MNLTDIVAWCLLAPLTLLVAAGWWKRWLTEQPAYWVAGVLVFLGLFLLERLNHDGFAWVSLGFVLLWLWGAWHYTHPDNRVKQR